MLASMRLIRSSMEICFKRFRMNCNSMDYYVDCRALDLHARLTIIPSVSSCSVITATGALDKTPEAHALTSTFPMNPYTLGTEDPRVTVKLSVPKQASHWIPPQVVLQECLLTD